MLSEVNEDPKKDQSNLKVYAYLAWFCVALGLVIIIAFLSILGYSSFQLSSQNIDMTVTGQVGDFIGGLVGSLWALAGFLLFYQALKIQKQELSLQRDELSQGRREFAMNRIINIIYKQHESKFDSLAHPGLEEFDLNHIIKNVKIVKKQFHFNSDTWNFTAPQPSNYKYIEKVVKYGNSKEFASLLFFIRSSFQLFNKLLIDSKLDTKEEKSILTLAAYLFKVDPCISLISDLQNIARQFCHWYETTHPSTIDLSPLNLQMKTILVKPFNSFIESLNNYVVED